MFLLRIKLRKTSNEMIDQKEAELLVSGPSDLSHKKCIHRWFVWTMILGMFISMFGNLIIEAKAGGFFTQHSSKQKNDETGKTISSTAEIKEFTSPYPFSKDEFVLNLGKILSSEDGRTTRETVERAFNVKFSDKPVKDAEKNYPNMSRFYLRPRVDWYFGMGLTLGEKISSFQLFLDSTMCIYYKDFREIAKNAGWKLVGEAQFFYHQPILREEYLKTKGANLFVDLSDGNSDCITYINMYSRS